MSELLRIDSMGNKGVNTDVAPWSLPAEFITSGLNFRIYSGSIIAAGGYKDWSTAPELFYPGHLYHVGATSSDNWVALGRTAVYSFDGNLWIDISSPNGAITDYDGIGEDGELEWTSCQIGRIPVFNNPQWVPEYWPSTGTELAPLPFDGSNTWADVSFSCKVMRSHKNFLIALDLFENGVEYPNAYRVSTAADINGLPYTWDETDKAGLAIRAQLGSDGGHIIDGLSLRDGFVIYSERAVDIINFTGDEFIWNRRELSNTIGLLSSNSIVEIKGSHYFLGDGDVYINNGNDIKSLMYGQIKTQFTNRINPDYYHRSFAVDNNAFKEIWFCVPVDGARYPNLAYIYNWQDESWSMRELPYIYDSESDVVVEGLAYAGYGAKTTPARTWDTWEGAWEDQTTTWGGRSSTPLNNTVVGVINQTSELKFLDPTGKFDSPFVGAHIERTDFALIDQKVVTTINEVYPHIKGSTPVMIEFGSQDYAGSPIRWKPATEFTPGADRKIDVRTTGELHCWRVISKDVGSNGVGNWRMSGMDISFVIDGER